MSSCSNNKPISLQSDSSFIQNVHEFSNQVSITTNASTKKGPSEIESRTMEMSEFISTNNSSNRIDLSEKSINAVTTTIYEMELSQTSYHDISTTDNSQVIQVEDINQFSFSSGRARAATEITPATTTNQRRKISKIYSSTKDSDESKLQTTIVESRNRSSTVMQNSSNTEIDSINTKNTHHKKLSRFFGTPSYKSRDETKISVEAKTYYDAAIEFLRIKNEKKSEAYSYLTQLKKKKEEIANELLILNKMIVAKEKKAISLSTEATNKVSKANEEHKDKDEPAEVAQHWITMAKEEALALEKSSQEEFEAVESLKEKARTLKENVEKFIKKAERNAEKSFNEAIHAQKQMIEMFKKADEFGHPHAKQNLALEERSGSRKLKEKYIEEKKEFYEKNKNASMNHAAARKNTRSITTKPPKHFRNTSKAWIHKKNMV